MASNGTSSAGPSIQDLTLQFEAYVQSLIPADFVGVERPPLDVQAIISEERAKRDRIRKKQAERDAAHTEASTGPSTASQKPLQMSGSLKRKIGGSQGHAKAPAAASGRSTAPDSGSDEEVSRGSAIKRKSIDVGLLGLRKSKKSKKKKEMAEERRATAKDPTEDGSNGEEQREAQQKSGRHEDSTVEKRPVYAGTNHYSTKAAPASPAIESEEDVGAQLQDLHDAPGSGSQGGEAGAADGHEVSQRSKAEKRKRQKQNRRERKKLEKAASSAGQV